MDKIIITKKIAKQGRNNIIVIPSYLREYFQAGSIVKIEIEKVNFDNEQNQKGEEDDR
jgi:bifunctional DNA-binding transcriptional regulator/antitoxin component of YhaV-PrlF toxin-antitoxin module